MRRYKIVTRNCVTYITADTFRQAADYITFYAKEGGITKDVGLVKLGPSDLVLEEGRVLVNAEATEA